MNFNPDVKKNICYVGAISAIFCALMLAVFVILGHFSLRVLSGALIGTSLAFFNFFLLALTLKKAISSEKSEKAVVALSYTTRTLMMFLLGIAAIVIFKVNPISLLLPYIFPRFSISVIRFLNFRKGKGGE